MRLESDDLASIRRRSNEAPVPGEGNAVETDEIVSLVDEVERSRALLRRIEWSGNIGQGGSGCPECEAEERQGHAPGCELAALLGDIGNPTRFGTPGCAGEAK